MRDAHPLERAVGVEYYVSDAPGTGGRLKAAPGDFRVRELETVDPEPLGADDAAYPHLVLRVTLEGWDTNDFARELSNRLGIGRERVSWAGTKDKRAVSTQLVTVRGVGSGVVPSLPNADLEPVGRLGRGLAFGDLAGNAFTVRVRDAATAGNAALVDEELREFGGGRVAVPNYFGQQRFGSRRPVTHEVGFDIVARDWEAAVLEYVATPHDAEPEDTRAAREYIGATRDWRGGLDRMPGRLRFERAILHRLVELDGDGDAYREALDALPANLQRLFVHAAQSAMFNRMLSRRLERGLPFTAAVDGDVVCFGTEVDGIVVPDPDRTQRVTPDRVDTVNRHVRRGRAFVTAPLVGTGTALGEGEPGEIERAVLEEYGVSPGDFALPEPYDSSGTRRAIAVSTDLSCEESPLRFEFALPKGSYATVVLREYLKVSPAALDGEA